MELLSGDAGGGEGADVLAESAAQVEEDLRFGLETLEEGGIVRREGYAEVKEAELAYAGVGPYLPGLVALGGC